MVSSQSTSNLLFSRPKLRITSVNRPTTYLTKPVLVAPKLPNLYLNKNVNQNIVIEEFNGARKIPLRNSSPKNQQDDLTTIKLYAILEAISDRIEMHHNVMEQRENWNSFLLNSINVITLTATTMAGISAIVDGNLPLKVSSMVLFLAATGLVFIMNKIQPSQLAQEQRNAVRLFKQLKTNVEFTMILGNPSRREVDGYMEQVLALDRAYPLPLLGAMLEKFPETFEPAVWWPKKKSSSLGRYNNNNNNNDNGNGNNNGWSKELEEEMRDIVEVMEKKDLEDYVRLGNKALKLNKKLAILGPMLTGIAAVGTGFLGHGVWGGVVAGVAGSLASVVNTIEHGGQVGMVLEMYRNCGGFFRHMEEKIESTLEEGDFEKRENGELFEMKMGLKLGRSLSELRDLANKSRRNGGCVDEFASKLF